MISVLCFALSLFTPALAQDLDLPVMSPRATVSQQVGTVTVTVDYSSPGKRDRTIFGELVPWGELWRTGANAPTTLTVDGDVTVGGKLLSEGTYSVFTKPGETEWAWMINRDATARTGSYDAANDVVTMDLKPMEGAGRERLTFLFEDTTDDGTSLVLEWAGTRVALPISVDSHARGNAAIEDFEGDAMGSFVSAARFKGEQGQTDEALRLVDTALSIDEHWYAMWAKAEILHGAERHKEAMKAAKAAMKLGEAAESFFYKSRVEHALETWPKK